MRICSAQNCNYNVFGTDKNTGKGYCKIHQFLRSDIVRTIKKKSIKERNKCLSKNKYDFDVFQWGFKSELSMFRWIWKNRPHRSEISRRDLMKVNHSLFLNMFAHILPKKQYPLFRYNPNNIMQLAPIEHTLIDKGTEKGRENYKKEYPKTDFSIFYNKKKELLKSYPMKKILFEKNN